MLAVVYVVMSLALVIGIVAMSEGSAGARAVSQESRRTARVWRQSTHIPIKVNQAGVIPVIFASSVLAFPGTLAQFIPGIAPGVRAFMNNMWAYNIVYVGLIILFAYFYTGITFNPVEVADNMRKYGGFIPGFRPGRPTAEYLDRVLTRLTFVGAIFLAIIALLPNITGD